MKTEHKYISCCGKYYCALCVYFRGSMVEAARSLLGYAERIGSLRLIADGSNACNFDEFMKGLMASISRQTMQRLPIRRRLVMVARLPSSRLR